jgi:hypothetical protein
MPSAILTDGATFSCKHGGTGTVESGIISISAVAPSFTVGGHKPILAGATISFTPASGCTFPPLPGGPPNPCSAFSLPTPSEQTLTIDGHSVYTAADAAAIALVSNIGNSQPGLTISEPQSLVTA